MQVLRCDAALGPWLLACVVLCLLGAGPLEAQVIQTPRYLITKTGKELTVTCSQNMDHECMYWYRQDPGLGLKLIYFSLNIEDVNKGDISDGYTVSRKEKKNFPLTLESTSIHQTSLYLCASSLSTAQHRQLLSAQKGAATKTRRLLPLGGPTQTKRKSAPPPLSKEALPTLQLQGPMGQSSLPSLYEGDFHSSGRTSHCERSGVWDETLKPSFLWSFNLQTQLNCCLN